MKLKIYNALVNKHPVIRERYHKFRDKSGRGENRLAWLYLLWLNLWFYVLKIHCYGDINTCHGYKVKKLPLTKSESELLQKDEITVDSLVEKLSSYDVISFDIFDTMIFRPFSAPTDLFFFLGERLGRMDFKNLRMQAEWAARQNCFKKSGHYEVSLRDIWEGLERKTGWSAESGMQEEIALEKHFCYANPFMLEVYRKSQALGKTIVIVSDMYLPGAVLEEILNDHGFSGFAKLYVSCEYKKSKNVGDLFKLVKEEFPGTMVHVGDNAYSDVSMAKKLGVSACHYPNVNECGNRFRSFDMSAIIGGAYRGIVNNHLYSRESVYSMDYEYGFVYGGLFVIGYCDYIHEYCKKNQVDKILFLSRDGDVLKKVYDILFPGESTEYVYWSRRVATKLMACEDRFDFMRRFLHHKVNQGFSLEAVFHSMELESLLGELPEGLTSTDELDDANVKLVQEYLEVRWKDVLDTYAAEHRAAKRYFESVLFGCPKALAVDIGWAGSGAVSLNHLVQKVWGIPCEIIGMIAGTNTVHNAEPDASETFLQTGSLVSYLYSQRHNRDLLYRHDPNKNYNVYWELLLSSPTPQLIGFSENPDKTVKLCFGNYDANLSGISEIQNGILDFVRAYQRHFQEFPYMYHISGSDAYAPMLIAAGNDEKYLKAVEKRFSLEIHVG